MIVLVTRKSEYETDMYHSMLKCDKCGCVSSVTHRDTDLEKMSLCPECDFPQLPLVIPEYKAFGDALADILYTRRVLNRDFMVNARIDATTFYNIRHGRIPPPDINTLNEWMTRLNVQSVERDQLSKLAKSCYAVENKS